MRRVWLGVGFALLGCKGSSSSTEATTGARESPQASAQPALLAATTTASATPTATATSTEGGPPPAPFRGDEVLAPDNLSREPIGYTLSAAFRPADLMGPQRAPELNAAGVEAARKATELRLGIDLSPTRLRIVLLGHGFVLPEDSEIRSRSDRYGHVIVWPGAASYRPLAPGSLRALLGERRFDVAPITAAEVSVRAEEGQRRIGIRTRKVDVTTRAARASFEIGKLDAAGEGGILLCRMLLDLMNAPPGTAVCGTDELPVRAELRWTDKGSLAFELTATSLKRTDIPLSTLVVPPSSASFASAPLPVSGVSAMLSPPELAGLRTGDIDVGPLSPTVGDALTVSNGTLELRVLYIDGVPAAWAAPGAKGELRGLRRGRYISQWRTFLGDAVEPPHPQVVPGIAQIGMPDAGR